MAKKDGTLVHGGRAKNEREGATINPASKAIKQCQARARQTSEASKASRVTEFNT